MKILKYVALIIGVFVLVFVGVGMFLPKQTHVERQIFIDAPHEFVFNYVSSHKMFRRWSPWEEYDPSMKVVYEGPEVGVGSKMVWASEHPNVGSGSTEYTMYKPHDRVELALDFGEMGTAQAFNQLKEKDGGTIVIWGFDTQHKSMIERYFGLLLDTMVGGDYEKGLQKLKEIVESEKLSAVQEPQIKTKEITYKVGDQEFTGFFAQPLDMPSTPGVLVVHEWWGHNNYARERAKMLAGLGYSAFALDMYGSGKTADHPDKAKEFMMAVVQNAEAASQRFKKAKEVLQSQDGVAQDKIAAIGYCFGGSVVMSMARSGVDLDGVVSFHGSLDGLPPIAEEAAGGEFAPVLVLNGAADPFVKPEHIEKFKTEMEAADYPHEFVNYPGALHAFTNPGATQKGEEFNLPLKYDPKADAASWVKMQNFLLNVFSD